MDQLIFHIAHGILIGMFLAAGSMKAFASKHTLAQKQPWSTTMPLGQIRFIGYAELLCALGLLLPVLIDALPTIIIAVAALGIALIMLMAIIFHVSRKEYKSIVLNVLLLLMADLTAYNYLVG